VFSCEAPSEGRRYFVEVELEYTEEENRLARATAALHDHANPAVFGLHHKKKKPGGNQTMNVGAVGPSVGVMAPAEQATYDALAAKLKLTCTRDHQQTAHRGLWVQLVVLVIFVVFSP